MAAKPESISISNYDQDLKMFGTSPIEYLFTNLKVNDKGTIDESTLAREHPVCLKGDNSNDKIEKAGLERSKL